MEGKYLVILSLLGVVGVALAVPVADPSHHEGHELEDSFGSSPSDVDPSDAPRDKRDLLKKIKKHHDAMFFNRGYESTIDYRPNREIHHHHYSYPAPPPYQPSHDQHHYHGASHGYQQGGYQQGGYGSSYYSGGGANDNSNYYPQPSYGGNGGYGYVPPPQNRPISTNPLATGHNHVDRGQGAAAVNNIAIIHARSGASTNTNGLSEAESSALPHSLPVDVNDHFDLE